MKIKLNNMPQLQLKDLLRRRKMTLLKMLEELNITTYTALCIQCNNMGVVPPDEKSFNDVMPPHVVSDPQEGVVILEPISSEIESDLPQYEEDERMPYLIDNDEGQQPTDASQKKRGKRKVDSTVQ